MEFSKILDYTGNMQLGAYTKSDHKLDTLKKGLPDLPHSYTHCLLPFSLLQYCSNCTVVVTVSVSGDKFSVI